MYLQWHLTKLEVQIDSEGQIIGSKDRQFLFINEVMKKPTRKFVFLHLPKTGGTSFHAYLAGQFETHEVFHALAGFDVMAAAKENYAFYSGHLFWPAIEAIPDRVVFTIFRDPITRILSQFHYFKSFRPVYLVENKMEYLLQYKNLSLMDYLKGEPYIPETRNPQIRHFLDADDVGKSGHILDGDAALAKAMVRLDGLDAVGIFEHFDLTAKLICDVIGLKPPIRVDRLNVTDENHRNSEAFDEVDRQITAEHIGMIRANNSLDLKLYVHARARFAAMLKDRFPDDAARLQA